MPHVNKKNYCREIKIKFKQKTRPRKSCEWIVNTI